MKSERSEPPVSTLVLHVLYSSLYLRVDPFASGREVKWVKWSEVKWIQKGPLNRMKVIYIIA